MTATRTWGRAHPKCLSSLAVGDRIGGHFVQGHVDNVGRVLALTREGDAVIARFGAQILADARQTEICFFCEILV